MSAARTDIASNTNDAAMNTAKAKHCAGNVLDPLHGDRFEQDVVSKTRRDRDIDRDIVVSKRIGIGRVILFVRVDP